MDCQKILPNNQQCQAKAQHGKEYCFRHDPETKEAGLVASSKGGKNRVLQGVYGDPVTLESPQDVKEFIGKVINAVWAEGVPVPVGGSMGFLTRCWLDAYDASDFVSRLDKIEKKIEDLEIKR